MQAPHCPVSVILPFYNSDDTIIRALQSVLKQTLPPAEILCINDCSTDNGLKTLKAFKKSLPAAQANTLKIIDLKDNGGVYIARNIGLDKAKQDWLAFLDADDFWHPQKMEAQFSAIKQNPHINFLTHRVEVWTQDDMPTGIIPSVSALPLKPLNKHLVLWRTTLRTISVLMRNQGKYRFDETKRRSGDSLLWFEVIWNNEPALIINETLAWKGKGHYGVGGLSGNLKKAESEAQHTVQALADKGLISAPYAALVKLWFSVKFLKRLTLTALRKSLGKNI